MIFSTAKLECKQCLIQFYLIYSHDSKKEANTVGNTSLNSKYFKFTRMTYVLNEFLKKSLQRFVALIYALLSIPYELKLVYYSTRCQFLKPLGKLCFIIYIPFEVLK